jgi:glycosyltransferase involved in cell wall biosynthesis
MRAELGIDENICFLLQPTRVVPRKHIEQAIELARGLENESVLVITHDAGDTGRGYQDYLENYAKVMDVKVLFAADRFSQKRRAGKKGEKIFSLADAYQQCDLVTYPSVIEGFGNAFLETIYYRRPLVMSAYEIFMMDIRPKGFKVMAFDEFISPRLIEQVDDILEHPSKAKEVVDHNYDLGCKYYSFEVLKKQLLVLIDCCVLVAS